MPKVPFALTVPEPCAANWAAMPPAAQGRHCAACAQVVVDFTGMTDAELIRWFARPAAYVCGRFRPDQLGRPLLPLPPPRTPRWPAWLAAGAVVWTLQALAPAPAAAQRADRPYQRLQPLFPQVQAPRPAAPPAAEAPAGRADESLQEAKPLPTLPILGGAMPGVSLTLSEPPPRPSLLRLEDWLH